MTVHSYENGYRTLGRQLLLLPVQWTADGWFRVPEGIMAAAALPLPVAGMSQQPLLDASDDFTSAELGLQWGFWREYDATRFTVGSGALTLAARGKSLADSSALTTTVGGHAYTVEIDVEIESGCECGMMLFYDPQHATGFCGPGRWVRLANGMSPTASRMARARAACVSTTTRSGLPACRERVARTRESAKSLGAAQRAGRLPGWSGDLRQRNGWLRCATSAIGRSGAGVGSALGTTRRLRPGGFFG
jgi:hypothetical protein